jgi:hypothetical protein
MPEREGLSMSFCESSLEFDLYEEMRRKLALVLTSQGRDAVEAERISLYVMQGVREVPRLLNGLAGSSTTDREVLHLLDLVLGHALSLDKARALLLGQGEEPLH